MVLFSFCLKISLLDRSSSKQGEQRNRVSSFSFPISPPVMGSTTSSTVSVLEEFCTLVLYRFCTLMYRLPEVPDFAHLSAIFGTSKMPDLAHLKAAFGTSELSRSATFGTSEMPCLT